MTGHHERLADYNEARTARIRLYVEGVHHLSLEPTDIEAHRALLDHDRHQLSIHHAYACSSYRLAQTSTFEQVSPTSVELPAVSYVTAQWLGHILLGHPLACTSDVTHFVSGLRLSPSSCHSYAQRLIDRLLVVNIGDNADARMVRLVPTRTTVRHSVMRELHFLTDVAVTSSVTNGFDYARGWPPYPAAQKLYSDMLGLYKKYLTEDEFDRLAPRQTSPLVVVDMHAREAEASISQVHLVPKPKNK